jgi:hypothetical protein
MHMTDLRSPCLLEHAHNLHGRGASHDGVVYHYNPLPFQDGPNRGQLRKGGRAEWGRLHTARDKKRRAYLELYSKITNLLAWLDESATHVMRSDEPLLEGDPRLGGESQG